ncbi:MAG: prephenate dehydratase [Candidatus Micrarchaeia archaeon]
MADEIEARRLAIDRIDRRLVALIAQRVDAARVIGAAKKKTGRPIRDKAREEKVKQNAVAAAGGAVPKQGLLDVFEDIIECSAQAQEKPGTVVAFQGERGAYSEEAANIAFSDCIPLACRTFPDAIAAVENGTARHAILPIENSVEGPVVGVHDLLLDAKLKATAEILLPVRHCLLALAGQKAGDVREVYSHPQALGQCEKTVAKLLPNAKLVPFYDTAGAAKMIFEHGLLGAAAIASERAGRAYGLEVLAKDIQDQETNTTRFLVFSQPDDAKPGGDKTSAVFTLAHKPGSLYSALKGFADEGVNVSRIESRPIKHTPWEYVFFLDFEENPDSAKGRTVLDCLSKNVHKLNVIGCYRKAGQKEGAKQ